MNQRIVKFIFISLFLFSSSNANAGFATGYIVGRGACDKISKDKCTTRYPCKCEKCKCDCHKDNFDEEEQEDEPTTD